MGKYAIDFETVRMTPAPGDCGKRPLNKHPEDPVGVPVGFLLVIPLPYILSPAKIFR
jgi:hypothetical protein